MSSNSNVLFQYLQERFGDTYQVDTLVFLITVQGFLVFAFVISAFVVAGTANAGFNCVLTAFLNLAVTLGGYYVIKHSRAPIAYGFLIGSSIMMIALNFMTAIYWTKLSYCKEFTDSIPHYSCHQKSAYVAVSLFSILLLLSQTCFSTLVYIWKENFIEDYSASYPSGGSQFTLPRTGSSASRGAYAPIHSTEL